MAMPTCAPYSKQAAALQPHNTQHSFALGPDKAHHMKGSEVAMLIGTPKWSATARSMSSSPGVPGRAIVLRIEGKGVEAGSWVRPAALWYCGATAPVAAASRQHSRQQGMAAATRASCTCLNHPRQPAHIGRRSLLSKSSHFSPLPHLRYASKSSPRKQRYSLGCCAA